MNGFSRSQTAALVLVTVMLLSFFGWRQYTRSHQSPETKRFFPMGVIIQVSGKVRAPGTYSFAEPITVGQAVVRAGGLYPGLRLEPQEASLTVGHGRHVSIMASGKTFAHARLAWMSVPNRLVLRIPLDVNGASAAELALVPGISQPLARRIVNQRIRLAGFSRLEDLRTVDGIGPAGLRRLRQYLTVGSSSAGSEQRAASSK
jgi:competence protein ComEA